MSKETRQRLLALEVLESQNHDLLERIDRRLAAIEDAVGVLRQRAPLVPLVTQYVPEADIPRPVHIGVPMAGITPAGVEAMRTQYAPTGEVIGPDIPKEVPSWFNPASRPRAECLVDDAKLPE